MTVRGCALNARVPALLITIVLLSHGCEATGTAQVWNATAAFSIHRGNPNGAFTYAYLRAMPPPPNLGASVPPPPDVVVLMDRNATQPSGDLWAPKLASTPHIMKMNTAALGAVPGQLVMHPGCQGAETAALVWTAPRNGTFLIETCFYPGDVGTALAGVYMGNVTLLSQIVPNTQPVRYFAAVRLTAQDRIFITVGIDGSCGAATTPVDAVITEVAQAWDVVQSFSITESNPNNASGFSYGYVNPGFDVATGPSMSYYDTGVLKVATACWNKGGVGTPSACLFREATNGILPGQLSLHAGCPSNAFSAVRWVSPHAGTFVVRAWFGVGDGGATTANVFVRGSLDFTAVVTSKDVVFGPQTFVLNASDEVLVGVGVYGSCTSGSTPVLVVISDDAPYEVPHQLTTLSRPPSGTRSLREASPSRTVSGPSHSQLSLLTHTKTGLRGSDTAWMTSATRLSGTLNIFHRTNSHTLHAGNRTSPPAPVSNSSATQRPSLAPPSRGPADVIGPAATTVVVTAGYGGAAVASALSPSSTGKPSVTSRLLTTVECSALAGSSPTPNSYALLPAVQVASLSDAAGMVLSTVAVMVAVSTWEAVRSTAANN